MSDVAKWALLVAGAVVLIALIVSLPFVEFINVDEFTSAINTVVSVCASGFQFGRGLLNNFLSPFGRLLVTGILVYLFGKFFIGLTIKITSWIYHFIFK